MRIWIDGYEANVPQRLGSSQVAFELLTNLERIDKDNDYTICLPSEPRDDLPKSRNGWRYKILKPSRLWTRIALPLALFKTFKKPKIFFSPTHYIPRFSPVKRVVTIFDTSYLHFPEMFKKKDLWQLTNWTRYSIENAQSIITISEFSKTDIVKQYSISPDRIDVAHPGYNSDLFYPISDTKKIQDIKKKYGIGDNYIIYIGTIQPRKNLSRLIDAMAKLEGVTLVVVGKTTGEGRQGWMFEEILKRPKEVGLEDRIIFTGFVPDQDLPYLLNGSIAFILPSLWEGFGIPVVDAMACGKPVLVSNVSSLPEVVGKAGITFDPYSVDDIAKVIQKVYINKKLRDDLSSKSLERAKKYSWVNMAEVVLKVFERFE